MLLLPKPFFFSTQKVSVFFFKKCHRITNFPCPCANTWSSIHFHRKISEMPSSRQFLWQVNFVWKPPVRCRKWLLFVNIVHQIVRMHIRPLPVLTNVIELEISDDHHVHAGAFLFDNIRKSLERFVPFGWLRWFVYPWKETHQKLANWFFKTHNKL